MTLPLNSQANTRDTEGFVVWRSDGVPTAAPAHIHKMLPRRPNNAPLECAFSSMAGRALRL